MHRLLHCLTVCALVGVGGCRTASVTTSHRPVAGDTSIPYYLPRTVLVISAAFEVHEGVRESDMVLLQVRPAEGEKALTVTVSTEPDPDERLYLNLPPSANFAGSSFIVGLSETGLLTSLNASYEDKTTEVISATIGAVLSLTSVIKTTSVTWTKTDFRFVVTKVIRLKDLLEMPEQTIDDVLVLEMPRWVNDGPSRVPGLEKRYPKRKFDSVGPKQYPRVGMKLITPAQKLRPKMTISTGNTERNALPGVMCCVSNPGTLEIGFENNAPIVVSLNLWDSAPVINLPLHGRRFGKRTDAMIFTQGALTRYERNTVMPADGAAASLRTTVEGFATKQAQLDAERRRLLTESLTRERSLAGLRVEREALDMKIVELQSTLQSATPPEQAAIRAQLTTAKKERAQMEISIRALMLGVSLP